MNKHSRDWGKLCVALGLLVAPGLLVFVFLEQWAAFLILCDIDPQQALGFWARILGAHTSFLTVLGILQGFSGVSIFYQMRRYDQFQEQVEAARDRAMQMVIRRVSARAFLSLLEEARAKGHAQFPAKRDWKWAQSQLLAMQDEFVGFARIYVAWGVFVLVFGALVGECLALPPILVVGSSAIPLDTVWIPLLGHTLTVLFAISVLLGFLILVGVSMSKEKADIDLMDSIDRAMEEYSQSKARGKTTSTNPKNEEVKS